MATDTPFPTSPAETTAADTTRTRPIPDSDVGNPLTDDYGMRSPSLGDGMRNAPTAELGSRDTDGEFGSTARAGGLGGDDLIGRIAQTAHETIDRLAESAAPHVNRLQESLSGDSLHQRADEMRELRDEWTESLRCTVRDNPLAAVGVALAVGVLIARLSR